MGLRVKYADVPSAGLVWRSALFLRIAGASDRVGLVFNPALFQSPRTLREIYIAMQLWIMPDGFD
jgi:hypothetical protein